MKHLAIFLLALVMLIISACFSDAELVLKNGSSADAWVKVDNNPETYIRPQGRHTFYVSSPRTVKLEYHGHHIMPNILHVDIDTSSGENVNLVPNCGALRIYNSGFRDVRAVYISPAGQNNWGQDQLSGFIVSGAYEYFRLNPGLWDVKLKDENNNFFYYAGLNISLDSTFNLYFNGR